MQKEDAKVCNQLIAPAEGVGTKTLIDYQPDRLRAVSPFDRIANVYL